MEFTIKNKVVFCDYEDLIIIKSFKWHFIKKQGTNLEYVITKINGKTHYLHRIILQPLSIDDVVIFKNLNTFDFRKSNLIIKKRGLI